jgi:hypothetical protein
LPDTISFLSFGLFSTQAIAKFWLQPNQGKPYIAKKIAELGYLWIGLVRLAY